MSQDSKKTILGLDLGTNSIGWALVETEFEKSAGQIIGLGTRIIPMGQDQLGDFDKGNTVSQTAERTRLRMTRRLRERYLLRRERLHRVLGLLNLLPSHYSCRIDFDRRPGKFLGTDEPKMAYDQDRNNMFVYEKAFDEMLEEFKRNNSAAIVSEAGRSVLIPKDWTLYYLRKKALYQKITREELAWVIMSFNQKRGYQEARGEQSEETPNKLVEFHSLRVTEVTADEESRKKGEIWYSVHLENGWTYRRASKIPLFDWKSTTKDFIVTTDLNEDGTVKRNKDGEERRSFRAPNDDDWTLLKKKTEHEISVSGLTVGEYIYNSLLVNPTKKVKGNLVRTIDRRFYKDELIRILKKQAEFHDCLQDENLFLSACRELYRNNATHVNELKSKNIVHLLVEDVIFYQRPLRSQKGLISDCPLESRSFKDKNGVVVTKGIKVTSKSNPYFQEFRIWQWISNLRIYDNREANTDVTKELIQNTTDEEALFQFLMSKAQIGQKTLLKWLLEKKGLKGRAINSELENYRWNYVEDKEYPCNETGAMIRSRLDKVSGLDMGSLTFDIEYQLWHIIYSVTNSEQYQKALSKFAQKHNIDAQSFTKAFGKVPPFKSEYAAFSEKALRKLLTLTRRGTYWSWSEISSAVQDRILKIINAEYDETIRERVREKSLLLNKETDFQGLPVWLAQYIIYNRHSEAGSAEKWNSPNEIDEFLTDFKQHSLRNPIVEQVVTETLRVVRDIWKHYGKGAKDYFREIHIELGRELKSTAEQRKKMTVKITENELANQRIKKLLAEMANYSEMENVRPFSPSQQEILRIYEEGVLDAAQELDDDINKIIRTPQPTAADLRRYKLWLEQKYRSPYTGEIIPLNKLFTTEYEIEHVIPQSRYFDDSYTNKVICEAAINRLKGNQLGMEFIQTHRGEVVELGLGKTARVFAVEDYKNFVARHYSRNHAKRTRLLLEDIPEQMIERQLNDTRYISKYVSGLLSSIVRSAQNDDGINSKNLIPGNGKITTQLKQDWGLNDVWNDIVLPRFERLNKLTGTNDYTTWSDRHQKFIPTVPLALAKGFSKKRIDHRHHALDALVIATMTRDHVNLINNQYANSEKRFDLSRKLRNYETVQYEDFKTKELITREVPREFRKPWATFTQDAQRALERVIISFKQNLRVINKATNHYTKWIDENGVKVKRKVPQEGANWAIRKPLHKDTVSGKVNLKWVKVPKGKILTATRKPLDSNIDAKSIESITDTGIQKILKRYLAAKGGDPEVAFSPEGVEELNRNISLYNEGKQHKPIRKVRVFESGSKFALGNSGNKNTKYVEAAKGTNLYFGVYIDTAGKRSFETIPLNIVIERIKQGLSPIAEVDEKGRRLNICLSPNDLVQIPAKVNEVSINGHILNPGSIYKVVSFSGGQIFFVLHTVSRSVVDKVEFSALNKMERSIDGQMIKDVCIKYSVSRLGTIHT